MDTHKNARLTPKGREDMVRAVVDGGQSCAAAAHKFNTTPKTVAKWVERFRAEGVHGLRDRSSRPLSSDSQTPQATCDAIEAFDDRQRIVLSVEGFRAARARLGLRQIFTRPYTPKTNGKAERSTNALIRA